MCATVSAGTTETLSDSSRLSIYSTASLRVLSATDSCVLEIVELVGDEVADVVRLFEYAATVTPVDEMSWFEVSLRLELPPPHPHSPTAVSIAMALKYGIFLNL